MHDLLTNKKYHEEHGQSTTPMNEEENKTSVTIHDKEEEVTSLSHFVYFLFAPTGLYAPSYPRTANINWIKFFLFHWINFTIVFISIRFIQECFYPLNEVGVTTITRSVVNRQMFLFSVFSVFHLVFFNFIGIQHNWLNSFAEVMRFADRHFYSDFWTFEIPKDFHRKWHLFGQEYLYYTVYSPGMFE